METSGPRQADISDPPQECSTGFFAWPLAKVLEEVASVLMGASVTALTKPDGVVRGIATGCSLRRSVARISQSSSWRCSKQSARRFNTLCGSERGQIVGHMLRTATDVDPALAFCDHISLSAMLGGCCRCPVPAVSEDSVHWRRWSAYWNQESSCALLSTTFI